MDGKLRISFSFCLLGALGLLVLPIRWAAGFLTAVLVHELSHIGAVILCGGTVFSISLGSGGARIESSTLPRGKAVFCALAGPLGSFSLLILAKYFPEAALCGLLQGLYNLLPIYPLDGGRILRFLLSQSVCRGVAVFFCVLGSGIGIWIGTYSADLGVILLISLWLPMIQRKLSCKDGKLAVQ